MEEKKIKIFVDAHAFDNEYQGTQTFIKGLYTAIIKSYPQLEVYFGTAEPVRLMNALPTVKSANVLTYKKYSLSLLRFVWDIPHLIRKHKFDFAHFQYLSPLKQKGCKYIVTLHDVVFNDFPSDFSTVYRKSRQLLFGHSIKHAAIKTTVSGYSQQCISMQYQIAKDKIHVLPNAVSNEFENGITHSNAKALIKEKYGIKNFMLYVSRVEPRKNHSMLLKAWLQSALYEQDIPLVFIGKASVAVEELNMLINQFTDRQRSKFYWFQDIGNTDLIAFYKACRLFVYPSRAEGFGIPPLEAALVQVPVLCSSATAMQSFAFFDPYRFDPANEAEFIQKLQHMICYTPDQPFLEQVALQVKEQYSWQRTAEIFYDLIQTSWQN